MCEAQLRVLSSGVCAQHVSGESISFPLLTMDVLPARSMVDFNSLSRRLRKRAYAEASVFVHSAECHSYPGAAVYTELLCSRFLLLSFRASFVLGRFRG